MPLIRLGYQADYFLHNFPAFLLIVFLINSLFIIHLPNLHRLFCNNLLSH